MIFVDCYFYLVDCLFLSSGIEKMSQSKLSSLLKYRFVRRPTETSSQSSDSTTQPPSQVSTQPPVTPERPKPVSLPVTPSLGRSAREFVKEDILFKQPLWPSALGLDFAPVVLSSLFYVESSIKVCFSEDVIHVAASVIPCIVIFLDILFNLPST